MADSGGHWKTLTEAQKLTQSTKIPGVFEEDIKRGNPLDRLTVGQAAHSGLKIEWLREDTTTEESVTEVDIGDQLTWSDDIEYEEKEMTLRRVYIQRKLDHYVEGIYGTYNNYEARQLLECEKGLKRRVGARAIYADNTYNSSRQFDGLHALAAEHGAPYTAGSTNDPKNIDQASAGLSLALLRVGVDAMKYGCDELWFPYEIMRRVDAAYQERGFAGLATATAGNLGFLQLGYNDLGKRVLFWDGIPIIRTDYLVGEEDGTGTGSTSNARALYSTDQTYSIFGIKHGNVMNQEPGLTYAYANLVGRGGQAGDFYKLVRFPELEDYDAGGMRLVNYGALLLGSSLCLMRMFDVDDVAITV